MEALPVELLSNITSDFSPQDFRQLRATNKRLHAFAHRAAFQKMKVINTLPSVQGFFQLLHEQSVRDCVEVVEFVEGDEVDDAGLFEHITKAFTDLYLAPRVQQLTLKFNVEWNAEEYMFEDSDSSPSLQLQRAVIAGLAASRPIGSLRSWIVKGLLPFDNPYWTRLRPLLQPLHLLDLEMICYDTEGGFYEENMNQFFDLALNKEILPVCTSLHTLALRPQYLRVGVIPLVNFRDLSYPALTSLVLENFMFHWHSPLAFHGQPVLIGGAEDFIASHGQSLKSLKLLNCGALVTENDDSPARYWSEIWRRFSTELSALVEVDVEFENRKGRTTRYFREDTDYGSLPMLEDLPGEGLDPLAFLEFKAVVNDRCAGQVQR